MHIFGKILAWLSIPIAIAAIALSSRLIVVRNSWTKQVVDLRKANESRALQITDKRLQLNELQMEYNRTVHGWNQYWDNLPTSISARNANSVVVDELGTSAGLIQEDGEELPVLSAFQKIGDNEFRYVGPFQAIAIDDAASELSATWTPRSGEVEQWNTGERIWRWRGMIPASYFERFADLQNALSNADQILVERIHNLSIQDELIDAAKKRLAFRHQELLGDPANQGDEGLVGAVEVEEEERNASLHELDRLRRAQSDEVKRRQDLDSENRTLVDVLPQAKGLPVVKSGIATTETKEN